MIGIDPHHQAANRREEVIQPAPESAACSPGTAGTGSTAACTTALPTSATWCSSAKMEKKFHTFHGRATSAPQGDQAHEVNQEADQQRRPHDGVQTALVKDPGGDADGKAARAERGQRHHVERLPDAPGISVAQVRWPRRVQRSAGRSPAQSRSWQSTARKMKFLVSTGTPKTGTPRCHRTTVKIALDYDACS